jgi:hypothetical protein
MRIYKTWFKWSFYDPPGHCKSWGASVHHTPTFCLFEANWSLLRGGQLWVLRSTLTLKTTDTTLVSVDGNIGHRGALVPLPHASPDTITEGNSQCHCHTPAIPWTWEAETGVTSVVTELRTKSWHRSMPLQRCNTKTTGLCKTLHLMSVPIWSLL